MWVLIRGVLVGRGVRPRTVHMTSLPVIWHTRPSHNKDLKKEGLGDEAKALLASLSPY